MHMGFAPAIDHSFAFLTWERNFHKVESEEFKQALKKPFVAAVFSREQALRAFKGDR
jgi:hypothetical protein